MSAFCTEVWQFYLAHALCIMRNCKFGLTRSLMSKCVDSQEIGKMLSGLAIILALFPLAANPAFRQLYNYTLPIFPGAEIIMSAGLLGISAMINFYLFTQRHHMTNKQGSEENKFDQNTIGITQM